MKTILVKADFECVVLVDGEQLGVLDGGELQFKSEKSFVITIFPINNAFLPYCCKCTLKSNLIECNSSLCEVTNLPMNFYELNFSPYVLSHFKAKKQKIRFLDTPYGKLKAVLTCFENSHQILIQLLKNENLLFEKQYDSFEKEQNLFSSYIENEFFIFLQGMVQDYQHIVVLNFNGEVKESLELLAHQVELEKDCIKTMSKCFDLCKHGRVNIYKQTNANFFCSSNHLVLLKENIENVKEELIPYAFFENLMVGDLKQSRTYLTKALNDSIDDEHLKAYFGDFISVRQNTYTNQENSVVLIYNMQNQRKGKVCVYKLDNGKIDNLELIN